MFALMDKVLERLVPKATASADTSWYQNCSGCSYFAGAYGRWQQLCHVVGGMSSCSRCEYFKVGC